MSGVAYVNNLDRAMLNVMADDLAFRAVDLGDETQIILALAGRYEPRLIDMMLDTVIEAARRLRVERAVLPEDDWLRQLLSQASAEQEETHGGL